MLGGQGGWGQSLDLVPGNGDPSRAVEVSGVPGWGCLLLLLGHGGPQGGRVLGRQEPGGGGGSRQKGRVPSAGLREPPQQRGRKPGAMTSSPRPPGRGSRGFNHSLAGQCPGPLGTGRHGIPWFVPCLREPLCARLQNPQGGSARAHVWACCVPTPRPGSALGSQAGSSHVAAWTQAQADTQGPRTPHTPTWATGRSLPCGGGALSPRSPQPAPGPARGRRAGPAVEGAASQNGFCSPEWAPLHRSLRPWEAAAALPRPGNCQGSVRPSAGKERQEHGLWGKHSLQ